MKDITLKSGPVTSGFHHTILIQKETISSETSLLYDNQQVPGTDAGESRNISA